MDGNVENTPLQIGRLLRSSIHGFSVGTRVSDLEVPRFGALVRAPLNDGFQIFGLVIDIYIDEDGLVRQLATSSNVDAGVLRDTRNNRNVPLEMDVIAIGHELQGRISYMLPPRPPLSLDVIYLCTDEEICRFTNKSKLGYLRHLVRNQDLPISELIATHIFQSDSAHNTIPEPQGDPVWRNRAMSEVVALLRDEYDLLTQVLIALSDIYPDN